MANPPRRSIGHKVNVDVEAIISLFQEFTEEMSKHNFESLQEHLSMLENSFGEVKYFPLHVPIYGTTTKIKFQIISNFTNQLLILSLLKDVEMSIELFNKFFPCIEFIQYALNTDIGTDYDKILSGVERFQFSDGIVEEWLLLIYLKILQAINKFILKNNNDNVEGEHSILTKKATLHLLVVFRHIVNRKRHALLNGETNFKYSDIENIFLASFAKFFKTGIKYDRFKFNYAKERIFLEGVYFYFDSAMDISKFLNIMLLKHEKKGFRTLRSLISNDIVDISDLSSEDLVPHGINQGEAVFEIASRVLSGICSLYSKSIDIESKYLPIILEFLPFVLKVLSWDKILTLKTIAIQVCVLLTGTFERLTESVANEKYIDIIRDSIPFLMGFVASKIEDLSFQTRLLCFKMITWISRFSESFSIEELNSLLHIYSPKNVSIKEYLEMIKSVWIRTSDRGSILHTFLTQRMSEVTDTDVFNDDFFPLLNLIMQFLNLFSQNIKDYLDPLQLLNLTTRKIEEFLQKSTSNTAREFVISNTFCKILLIHIDHFPNIDNIYPITYDLIKIAITTEPIHRSSGSSVTNFSEAMDRLFSSEYGYFLDLIRTLQFRGLLGKCGKDTQEETSDNLINTLILPYVLEQSKDGSSNISNQAIWVIISFIVSDLASPVKSFVEITKNHIIDNCSFLLEGASKIEFYQRGFYRALLNLINLLFPLYPEEMIGYLIPNAKILFSSGITTMDTIDFFPITFNHTLQMAEYFLDNSLFPDLHSLLSLQVLFTMIHYMPINTINFILFRRTITKFELCLDEIT